MPSSRTLFASIAEEAFLPRAAKLFARELVELRRILILFNTSYQIFLIKTTI
jgi:hypothetical protein